MSASQPRLRVMFCIPELDRGGPDAVFFNLLRTLDLDRFEPFLVVTKPTGAYLDELPDHIPVLRTDERRYPVRSVLEHVRHVRPDVVLATLRMSFTCTAGRPFFPRRTTFVCRVANNVTGEMANVRSRRSSLKSWAITASYRAVVATADRVIAQSHAMRDDIEAQFGLRVARKTIVLPNPVDADRLLQLSTAADGLPPKGQPQLVSAGRLTYQKGFDRLVDAFARVRGQHPDARLWILGEGEEHAALEAQARAAGVAAAVDLLGGVANPAPLYRAADLYVCSSRYEGFPNAVAEALALGTPVVVPSGPAGGEELVTPFNGRIVDDASGPGLAAATLEALDRLGDLDRDRIAADCRSRFSLEAVTRRYEAVLWSTAGRRPLDLAPS